MFNTAKAILEDGSENRHTYRLMGTMVCRSLKEFVRKPYPNGLSPWPVGFGGGKHSTMLESLAFDTVLLMLA
ncbi:MAG: hypothetical protein HY735_35925 [Verrucomicrobia bacterium]|nr:hypothetical protein [Verrucomicrobiota bacterium]